jgi:hypothetical protein
VRVTSSNAYNAPSKLIVDSYHWNPPPSTQTIKALNPVAINIDATFNALNPVAVNHQSAPSRH